MGRLITAGTAAFLSIGGLLFGYDSGIISSTIAQPHFIETMGEPSAAERGGIVSSFTGGAILGALSISYIADYLGRKRTVFLGSVVATLGGALQGGAANIPMMIAGRLIAGMAIGLLSAVVPMSVIRDVLPESVVLVELTFAVGTVVKSLPRRTEASFRVSCNSCCLGAFSSLSGWAMAASKSIVHFSGGFLFPSRLCQSHPPVLPEQSLTSE
jgi:MFS family permease